MIITQASDSKIKNENNCLLNNLGKIKIRIEIMKLQIRYTPCLEKNGTKNVLSITLTNTNESS